METTDTINLNVDHIVETVISDAQERYEEGEIAYGAAVEAAEDHLNGHTYSMTEQMFIVETLLATLGLDKETYLYHTLEDAGYTSDSTAIIQQLCVNALTAVALQEGFDETVDHAESREESPPQELAVGVEEVVEELEDEAKDRYSNGTDAFDAAYDTLDTHLSELKSHSLTEQVAIIEYLATTHGIEDATPSEQLEDSVHDSTDLVVGSLLWHNLQEFLMTRLTPEE